MTLPLVSINYWAVLVAAIASMVVGFLWYGPLFGRLWVQLSGMTDKKLKEAKKKGMGKTYAIAFVSTLVMSYVLAHFVDYLEATNISGAVQLAFWLWLGFFATVQLGNILWEGKPLKLYLINVAHYLVALVVMSVILAVWQ